MWSYTVQDNRNLRVFFFNEINAAKEYYYFLW